MHTGTNGVLDGREVLCPALCGTLRMGKPGVWRSNWYGSDQSPEQLFFGRSIDLDGSGIRYTKTLAGCTFHIAILRS